MLWCRKLKAQKRNKTHEACLSQEIHPETQQNHTKPMSRVVGKERNVLLTRWRFETAEEMMQIVQTLSSPEAQESLEMPFSAETFLLVAVAGVFQKTAGDLLKMGNIGTFSKRNNACRGKPCSKIGDQGNYFVFPSFESFGGTRVTWTCLMWNSVYLYSLQWIFSM